MYQLALKAAEKVLSHGVIVRITFSFTVHQFGYVGITVRASEHGTVTASSTAAVVGTPIALTADAEEGYHFRRWEIIPVDIKINDDSFIMPDRDVTVWATFEQDSLPQPAEYLVMVNGSYATPSGAGSYTAGTTVSIHAGTRDNYRFTGWTSLDGISFVNAGSADTTFTMPEKAVTVTANWVRTGGGSSGIGSSSDDTTYPPTVEKSSNGTVSVSPSNPRRGNTVTVTPKPDDGYEVDKITVTNCNGKPVEVTKKPDGTYTFKQPSGKVMVVVTYQSVDWPWNSPFTDVSEGNWYYEAVRFVQERGLMNGYSDGKFGPNDTLSRAQFAQILFNKKGRPGVNYLLDFSDVASEVWYTEAIRWATSKGIVAATAMVA